MKIFLLLFFVIFISCDEIPRELAVEELVENCSDDKLVKYQTLVCNSLDNCTRTDYIAVMELANDLKEGKKTYITTKEKLSIKPYKELFMECELEYKSSPITFKATYQ